VLEDQGLTLRSKLVGDIAYEVDCAMIIVKEGEVDIGTRRAALIFSTVRS
jgi:hypothetical protein